MNHQVVGRRVTMKQLGKRSVQRISLETTYGYCGCRCSCAPFNLKQNAKNAAPATLAAALIEPMS